MIPDELLVGLAYGVAQLDSTLSGLLALRERPDAVVSDEVITTTTDDLWRLKQAWAALWLDPDVHADPVTHARGWLTEHMTELDKWLDRKEIE